MEIDGIYRCGDGDEGRAEDRAAAWTEFNLRWAFYHRVGRC